MLCDHQIQQCETQKVFQVDRNKFWMKTYNKKAMNGTVETTHTHTHSRKIGVCAYNSDRRASQ